MDKFELKDIQLYEEDGQYYLRLKYLHEDDHKVEEIEIPKARLPFNKKVKPDLSYSSFTHLEEAYISTGYNNSLELKPMETSEANHVFWTGKVLKYKPKEMTISEIEKKLGYKIKIVAEDEK